MQLNTNHSPVNELPCNKESCVVLWLCSRFRVDEQKHSALCDMSNWVYRLICETTKQRSCNVTTVYAEAKICCFLTIQAGLLFSHF